MKLKFLKLYHKNTKGFTLIEVMVALAITGVIGIGASVSSLQLLYQASQDTNYTSAGRSAANAIHWISRDALMAQAITGCDDFPGSAALSFSWEGWDNDVYSADYTVVDGTLWRAYSDGVSEYNTLIAEHVSLDEDLTFCTSDGGIITLSITCTAGEGGRTVNITRTRAITNRPGL